MTLPGLFSAETLERYKATVARVRSETDHGPDEYGLGDRIGQLHQREPDLLDLASHPEILRFLTWAFGEDPVLMGSLNFDKGTQQDAHIDAIFFWPEPSYSMAGVWIALEDVSPDAGPLFYLSGSHQWPFFSSDAVVASFPELAERREAARRGQLSEEEKASLIAELGVAWSQKLNRLQSELAGEPVRPALKAGDAVIWHSLLAHGGSPRLDPSLSRKSVVFHYFGSTAKLLTMEQFMLHDGDELPHLPPTATPRMRYQGLEYMRFDYFVTYSAKGQVVHPLG